MVIFLAGLNLYHSSRFISKAVGISLYFGTGFTDDTDSYFSQRRRDRRVEYGIPRLIGLRFPFFCFGTDFTDDTDCFFLKHTDAFGGGQMISPVLHVIPNLIVHIVPDMAHNFILGFFQITASHALPYIFLEQCPYNVSPFFGTGCTDYTVF